MALRDYIYLVPIVIPLSVLYLILYDLDISQLPFDNIRYTYSAIFQGFAALLAIMITAVLITLQNIHTQKFSIEEKIYKILGNRFDSHVPGTIDEIKTEIETERFQEAFREHLRQTTESLNQRDFVFQRIMDELIRKFVFLEKQKKHEKQLRITFTISVGISIVVLLYSMSALIIIPQNISTDLSIVNGTTIPIDEETIKQTFLFGINPIHALMIASFLVILSLMVFMQLMIATINVWKLKVD